MAAKAGPSKRAASPKKAKTAMNSASASEASDSESVDSNDIDEAVVETPRPAKAARRGAALPRYQPPIGMDPVAVSTSFKDSPFEYDALTKKGVELWAIRVPADFKVSRLSSLALERPSKKGVRGRLERSSGSYTLQTAEDGDGIGAEMAGMRLLVPNMKAGGKLMRAPGMISRRLILAPTDDKAQGTAYTPPPKVQRTQPEEKLKFRNRAYGFDTPGPSEKAKARDGGAVAATASPTQAAVVHAEEDAPKSLSQPTSSQKEKKARKEKEGKKDKEKNAVKVEKEGKKRKSEGESPKKKKKIKAE
ncbi:hypothetical protein CC85DRAFT_285154 [Cutaneotrichosporon oleaginosum]|uniref:DNA-directed RNA polymerase I subunit RPA34.5-domain-containing protein n=1 Tax=Cutaneotrichosporon oleaginosum TaxID=879819 RepID=A0A0J0XNY2_9TREE|nr:uncharacterized protein CC85DRAFT_285154 [Cutaneotrichosporon oleaginosum]KLT42808.1 hypothetical protein CC85DRAFT_285154 [Cutaneotrichosporon oleaginosum]TXT08224.1 hypothetical protein COLE_05148 [Cutaneotrichosporon oleaginosum]